MMRQRREFGGGARRVPESSERTPRDARSGRRVDVPPQRALKGMTKRWGQIEPVKRCVKAARVPRENTMQCDGIMDGGESVSGCLGLG